MIPLSRVWTWLGSTFVPIIFGWALYVRHAIDAPSNGETLSRAYFGLVITLALGAMLAWTWFLYVRAARGSKAPSVPLNTIFEEEKSRSALVGWLTALAFSIVVVAGTILFASSYGDSRIYAWDARSPVAEGFWSSRLEATRKGCGAPPCWTIDRRISDNGTPLKGVNEYVVYFSDGAILIAAGVLLAGVICLANAIRARRTAP